MIEEVEEDVCDVFEGVWGVTDSCNGQMEEVDRRAQRMWLQSTYRRGSLSSSDSMACEVIGLYRD